MSEHYPRIRIRAQNGYLLIREGVSLDFYMPASHREVASAVNRSLEVYLDAVGSHALSRYADDEGEWRDLDEVGWAVTRRELIEGEAPIIELTDASGRENRYRFEYHGKSPDRHSLSDTDEPLCVVSFWLPTEYLEERGPGRVRELALEIAAPLPFCSGNVGLSFNAQMDVVGVDRELRKVCFRYPGLNIPEVSRLGWHMGPRRVRGVSWLTFLGQPLLGELGGVVELHSRLHSPDTIVQEMEGERVIITLGPWPEAGDTERGDTLPAYRKLARVLEPWIYHEMRIFYFDPDDQHRWERRFLD